MELVVVRRPSRNNETGRRRVVSTWMPMLLALVCPGREASARRVLEVVGQNCPSRCSPSFRRRRVRTRRRRRPRFRSLRLRWRRHRNQKTKSRRGLTRLWIKTKRRRQGTSDQCSEARPSLQVAMGRFPKVNSFQLRNKIRSQEVLHSKLLNLKVIKNLPHLFLIMILKRKTLTTEILSSVRLLLLRNQTCSLKVLH